MSKVTDFLHFLSLYWKPSSSLSLFNWFFSPFHCQTHSQFHFDLQLIASLVCYSLKLPRLFLSQIYLNIIHLLFRQLSVSTAISKYWPSTARPDTSFGEKKTDNGTSLIILTQNMILYNYLEISYDDDIGYNKRIHDKPSRAREEG